MENTKSTFSEHLLKVSREYCGEVPSATATHEFVEDLMGLLFPFRNNSSYSKAEIEEKLEDLAAQLENLLEPLTPNLKEPAATICRKFMAKIPGVFDHLLEDADAFAQFDPAAECMEEVILCYPGFFSIAVYRFAHELYRLKVPVLPRVISEYAHSKTGVDIHPGARIGKSFFIDHGTGTVIGETAVIGDHVKIYQGVTLGALFVKKSLANKKRHPSIEDNVIIYARSTILGGETIVGHDTVIGGNVWLTESVLPHSIVYQQSKSVVRDSKSVSDQINWVI